jgi:glycerophosphoryl diester phosphodiesterase
MIFHDEDLRRMTGHAGRVDDLTSVEIAQLALPRGDAVPTLAETLEAFPDLNFNIDLKDAAGVEPVVRVLNQAGALQRVCITSFSERRLKAARRLLGAEVCTGLGVGGSLRFGLESLLPGSGRNRKAAVLQLPFRWHGVRLVTTGVVKRAHAAGLALHVWTLNDESDINLALDVGVDGVMTDRPRLLKEAMVSRGLWQADAPPVGGSEGRFTPSG